MGIRQNSAGRLSLRPQQYERFHGIVVLGSAVSGLSAGGTLLLQQTAVGGAGGLSTSATGGAGGAATSSLNFDDTASTTKSATLEGDSTATGGAGGAGTVGAGRAAAGRRRAPSRAPVR